MLVFLRVLSWDQFLFLLYINDICDDLVNNIRLFADDTSLYAIVENGNTNAAQSLTSDLDLVDKWRTKWLVDFNPNVDFSRKNKVYPPIKFGGNGPLISQNISHTHLGLYFQRDPMSTLHVQLIHEKATKKLNILRMLKYQIKRKKRLFCIY